MLHRPYDGGEGHDDIRLLRGALDHVEMPVAEDAANHAVAHAVALADWVATLRRLGFGEDEINRGVVHARLDEMAAAGMAGKAPKTFGQTFTIPPPICAFCPVERGNRPLW